MEIQSIIAWVIANGSQLIGAVSSIVGGFAILAMFTPNKTDDKILQIIMNVINFLGANLGKAKNSE